MQPPEPGGEHEAAGILGVLGGAAAAGRSPRVRSKRCRSVGFMSGRARSGFQALQLRRFHRGLEESGFVEGKNVAIEYRWARGRL